MAVWLGRLAGRASKIFALLAALTQLLATVEVTASTGLGFWGSLQVWSGNFNLGAVLLAMFDHCCEKDGGYDSQHDFVRNGGGSLLFVIAGLSNTGAAIILFGGGQSTLIQASALSIFSLLTEAVAIIFILLASNASAKAAPTAAGNMLRPSYG